MSKEEAIEILSEMRSEYNLFGDEKEATRYHVLSWAIKAMNAEPVVRCKDCEYGEPNGQYGCKCYHHKLYETHEMSPNDFCSKGKRRKDD